MTMMIDLIKYLTSFIVTVYFPFVFIFRNEIIFFFCLLFSEYESMMAFVLVRSLY
jgi:hypothetical protein